VAKNQRDGTCALPNNANAATIAISEAIEVEETVAYVAAKAPEERFWLYVEGTGEEVEAMALEALDKEQVHAKAEHRRALRGGGRGTVANGQKPFASTSRSSLKGQSLRRQLR
jgi:hypothetical protein